MSKRRTKRVRPRYWTSFSLRILLWHLSVWMGFLSFEVVGAQQRFVDYCSHVSDSSFVGNPHVATSTPEGRRIQLAQARERYASDVLFGSLRLLVMLIVMEVLTHFYPTFFKLLAAMVASHLLIIAGGAAVETVMQSDCCVYFMAPIGVLYYGGEPVAIVPWPLLCWLLTRRFGHPLKAPRVVEVKPRLRGAHPYRTWIRNTDGTITNIG